MKTIVLFVFAVLISSISRAQIDTSIIGSWKLVSIEMAGIYYNFKKDSISLPAETRSKYADETELKKLKNNIKMLFSDTKYYFEKDGIFKQSMMGETFNGSYRVFWSQNLIELTTKNSLNEDAIDKIKYDLKKGLLCLFIDWDDEEYNLVLEKD